MDRLYAWKIIVQVFNVYMYGPSVVCMENVGSALADGGKPAIAFSIPTCSPAFH
jgi:hypothetical protein